MDTVAKVDVKKMIEHTRYLSESCGSRWFGTPNNHKARNYIESVFSELPIPVEKQLFEEESVEVISHKMIALDPPLGEIDAIPVQNTGNTPQEGLTGEVVYLEGLQPPNIGSHLEGKVIFWLPERLMPIPMEILQYKPKAVIIVSHVPGVLPRHEHYPSSIAIPFSTVTSFKISFENCMYLMKNGIKKVQLHLNQRRFKGELCNILTEIKGSQYPDEIILVGAHYDCPPKVSGAMDNASGIGMMLELARVFAHRGSKRTLRFAAWDGEEPGCLGTLQYMKLLQEKDKSKLSGENSNYLSGCSEVDKHLFYLNLDVLGALLGQHVCSVNANKMVEDYLHGICGELGIHARITSDYYGSDHDLLAWYGIPSVNISRMGPAFQYIHTDADEISNIGEQPLEEGARIAGSFLQRAVADAETWLFDREVPELQRNQIAEWLKMLGIQPPK